MDKRIKVLKLLLPIGMFVLLIFNNLKTNVLDEIAVKKMHGLKKVPEVNGITREWEWYDCLECLGYNSVVYNEECLRDEIDSLSLTFSASDNDVGISVKIWLSRKDMMRMVLYVHYSYEDKALKYAPIGILQGGGSDYNYIDSESIRQYMSQYNITKDDIEECYEYAIYDVIVRTWTKRYRQFYGLEKWKLEHCTIDHSFAFGETGD